MYGVRVSLTLIAPNSSPLVPQPLYPLLVPLALTNNLQISLSYFHCRLAVTLGEPFSVAPAPSASPDAKAPG